MCIFVARGSTLLFWWEQFWAEWEPAISSYYRRLETQQQSSAQLLDFRYVFFPKWNQNSYQII